MGYDLVFCTSVQVAAQFASHTWVADNYKCSRAYVAKVTRRGYVFRGYKKRRAAVSIAQRRPLLKRLQGLTTTVGHRTWKKYPCASQLTIALNEQLVAQGKKTVTQRTVQRDLRRMGLRCRVRKPAPTRSPLDLEKRRLQDEGEEDEAGDQEHPLL